MNFHHLLISSRPNLSHWSQFCVSTSVMLPSCQMIGCENNIVAKGIFICISLVFHCNGNPRWVNIRSKEIRAILYCVFSNKWENGQQEQDANGELEKKEHFPFSF